MAHFKSAVVLCSVFFIAGALGGILSDTDKQALNKLDDNGTKLDAVFSNLSNTAQGIIKTLNKHDQNNDGKFNLDEITEVCNELKESNTIDDNMINKIKENYCKIHSEHEAVCVESLTIVQVMKQIAKN
ncbi:uncharacterized protein LOC126898764 isoform X1 [Daktulosphaira vitifoliae]|uniref:uncharacterized protein LOC126898763 n=1 Tax=Daktulosphaira vitifoliae TaxID=58002 RepID=UPI0021AA1C71|nr:uncharacterized protein LOC126898763 [Daktulosphaira vitifoliae]XP_050529039.1 uncharacterized protein LOC126898764 isoform X1 [Daktulosphaira vitifoliae]